MPGINDVFNTLNRYVDFNKSLILTAIYNSVTRYVTEDVTEKNGGVNTIDHPLGIEDNYGFCGHGK